MLIPCEFKQYLYKTKKSATGRGYACGATQGVRTLDLRITNALLYQLS